MKDNGYTEEITGNSLEGTFKEAQSKGLIYLSMPILLEKFPLDRSYDSDSFDIYGKLEDIGKIVTVHNIKVHEILPLIPNSNDTPTNNNLKSKIIQNLNGLMMITSIYNAELNGRRLEVLTYDELLKGREPVDYEMPFAIVTPLESMQKVKSWYTKVGELRTNPRIVTVAGSIRKTLELEERLENKEIKELFAWHPYNHSEFNAGRYQARPLSIGCNGTGIDSYHFEMREARLLCRKL